MAGFTHPDIPHQDEPPFTVWDVYWSTIAPKTSIRPVPRPEYNEVAIEVWDTITELHITSITVSASYPTINVQNSGSVFVFPGTYVSVGGSGGFTGTPVVQVPETPRTPDIAPVPVPAALPLLALAIFMLWRIKK